MNKAVVWIFVFITIISAVYAEEIQINTTITLDWIGGDEFYIRTESGDYLYSSMNQTDSVINLTFTKEVDLQIVNLSMESKQLLEAFKNVTKAVTTLNTTQELIDTKEAHGRVVIYYEDCKGERSHFESMYTNETLLKEKAQALTLTNTNVINKLREQKINCTSRLEEKEQIISNRFWLGFFVAVAIAGAGYWFMEDQKKGKVPKAMQDSGHPGLKRTK